MVSPKGRTICKHHLDKPSFNFTGSSRCDNRTTSLFLVSALHRLHSHHIKHCTLEAIFLTFRGIFLFRCQNTSHNCTDPWELIFHNLQFYLSPTSFYIFTFSSTIGKTLNSFKKKLYMCTQSNIRAITTASKYYCIFGTSCS